jgi:hypothetical protein
VIAALENRAAGEHARRVCARSGYGLATRLTKWPQDATIVPLPISVGPGRSLKKVCRHPVPRSRRLFAARPASRSLENARLRHSPLLKDRRRKIGRHQCSPHARSYGAETDDTD